MSTVKKFQKQVENFNSGFWGVKFVNENTAFVVGSDGTILRSKNLVTSVEENELLDGKIKSDFVLLQNYPNPFNPSTTIRYSIPTGTHPSIPSREGKERSERGVLVTLKVYDILGREVAILLKQKQRPGNYEITWDANNHPSGVYFYQLSAGDFISTKKMILLR